MMALVALYVALLLVGTIAAAELGRWLGRRRLRGAPPGSTVQASTLEASLLALLGLMVAFTFSGAADRFDQRRLLIIQEANDVSTAWLRLELLPVESRVPVRALFRDYVDARLGYYRALARDQSLEAAEQAVDERAEELWTACVTAADGSDAGTRTLLFGGLNAMFDTGSERILRLRVHPPWVVYALLFLMTLMSSLVASYSGAHLASRDWLQLLTFAVVMAITVYVILDLELPRHGLFRVDGFDAALVQLRERFDREP